MKSNPLVKELSGSSSLVTPSWQGRSYREKGMPPRLRLSWHPKAWGLSSPSPLRGKTRTLMVPL